MFQILGTEGFVHQDPHVTRWWRGRGSAGVAEPEGYCLVTGAKGPLARLHEPKIKGVAGAQSVGAAIVSFNDSAYCSYGRDQSLNAPVGADAACSYTTALNALLDSPQRDRHRFVLGGTTVAFWTDRPSPVEDIFAAFALGGSDAPETLPPQDEARRARLEAFLRALRTGRETYGDLDDEPEATGFYLLGLAPNAARLSIRFFHRGSIAELLDTLHRHHEDIRIEGRAPSSGHKGDPEFPSLQRLLDQTARERKEIPPVLSGTLLRAVITGSRYPDGMYQAVLRRIHVDRRINHARVCVIKGYLTRNLNQEISVSLDRERTDPSYRIGRLFAALEKTQEDALGRGINTTIRDRFYSAASATPRSVVPRLLRTYQHHLAKLEGGRRVHRERLVQEILDPIGEFPAHLDLAGQGNFALGYYHQRQDFYTKHADPEPTASSSDEGSEI